MQKAPGRNVRGLSVSYMGKGAERSRRVRCLLLEEKVASFACRMRWKCCVFSSGTGCAVYTQRHLIRRGVAAAPPSPQGEGLKSAQRYRPCGVYPTTPHPSRRDRRATFPSRGRPEKCAANGPRQSPRTQYPGALPCDAGERFCGVLVGRLCGTRPLTSSGTGRGNHPDHSSCRPAGSGPARRRRRCPAWP